MKLRVRSLESRETLKIQVPDPCSLHHFIHLLSLSISSSSSSSSSSSIYLSLNRKDELQSSSSRDSLQSLGLTSGDLIFYAFNPAAFSRQTHPPPSTETLETQGTAVLYSGGEETLIPSQALGSNSEETLIQSQTLHMTDTVIEEAPILSETLVSNSEIKDTAVDTQTIAPSDPVVSDSETNEAQGFSVTTGMDIEGSGLADDGPIVVKKSCSEPCFLRKVLREVEVGDDGNEHKLLMIAVHAVILDSGFVGFDIVSGMRVDRFHLSDGGPSMSLRYTLPELLNYDCHDSPAIQSVVLRFKPLGQFIYIYGSISSNKSTVHRVILDEYRFAPTLDLMWTHSNSSEEKDTDSKDSYPENEVFEFWKIVKDGLALPLLIDLCDKADLLPPPCLMRLPTELKLKILELLPSTDLAKVACVCSELRYLSSNNDLWKQKFIEEIGNMDMGRGISLWKDRFAAWWEMRTKSKRTRSIWKWFPSLDDPYYFPPRRDPSPFGIPMIRDPNPFDVPLIRDPDSFDISPLIGEDYDRFPGFGIPSPFGQPAFPYLRPERRYHPRLRANTIPRCNLGGEFMG